MRTLFFLWIFSLQYTALIPRLEICLEVLEKIDPCRPCWRCFLGSSRSRYSVSALAKMLQFPPNTSCLTTYIFAFNVKSFLESVKPSIHERCEFWVSKLFTRSFGFFLQHWSSHWNVLDSCLLVPLIRCLLYILLLRCSSSFRECILLFALYSSSISVLLAKIDWICDLPRSNFSAIARTL